MQNWQKTIISQYANHPIILALIESFNDAVDPSVNIDAFYKNMWNVSTAVGYGLDCWGRIVGVGRVLNVPIGGWEEFKEQGAGADAFGTLPLYSGNVATSNYTLDDGTYRSVIMAKAFSNISGGGLSDYNVLLLILFPGRGSAWCKDLGNMAAQLTFTFQLQPFEVTLLKQSGVILPPSGVLFTIVDSTGPR